MKKIFTLAISILAIQYSTAQEAGRAGNLIKNEASTSEMRVANRNFPQQTKRNNQVNTNRVEGRKINYQWNYNHGTAEVFLRIPEMGYYMVELDEQIISNSTGKYRFYDVHPGRNILSIYRNGYLVYRAPLQVQHNTRVILDFFEGYGLYLLDTQTIRNQNYNFNQWDDIWNNFYNNYNTSFQVMSRNEFDSFIRKLNNHSSFDEDKINLVRLQMKNSFFTSEQIKSILSKISFDQNKLTLAKELYHNCSDPKNYFVVYDVFTFRQYRNELMNYISRIGK